MYKGVGVRVAVLSHFLKYPVIKKLVSLRPNCFIFIGYLETGARKEFERTLRTPSGSASVLTCIGGRQRRLLWYSSIATLFAF